MPNFRRALVPGATFFFTVVTAGRQPILCTTTARRLLRKAIERERQHRPFSIDATVVLPDHLHMIWTLPPGDSDFSIRWSMVKGQFARDWNALGAPEQPITGSRSRERRRGVWQARFMEHMIRDERDFEAHVDYIHYNPVRHGLAERPVAWPWSSIHRYIRAGMLDPGWGAGRPPVGVDRVVAQLME